MKRFSPYIVFAAVWVVFSYQFFLKGLIPAPFDLLVNFFAPWDKYYDSPIKNPAITDVVNQIIPWKTYTAWALRRGSIPLWNPYNLAGAPHLANWQSGVLYPTNLLFLFLPFTTAWAFHILLQPLLAGIFMILFLRSFSLSPIASLLGALAFSYGGFMTAWFEWGTLGHTLLWLPLALYGVEKGRRMKDEGQRNFQWLIIPFSWTMSLFAGHLQISLYVIATTIAYFFFRTRRFLSIRKFALTTIYFLLTTILIAAPQLLPSIDLYRYSYRLASLDPEWFKVFRIPIYGLLTFLAPDFFGNPVTGNHWSDHSYIEMMGYIGLIPIIFAAFCVFAYYSRKKTSKLPISFFTLTILISILFSLKTPIANTLLYFHIPILSSSSPARIIGIAGFSLSALGAFGFDQLIRQKLSRGINASIIVLIGIFVSLWGWALFSHQEFSNISLRNLIFPTAILVVTVGIILWWQASGDGRRTSQLVACGLLLVAGADLFRFHQKFTPFTDKNLFYPEIPSITFLKDHPGRTFGMFDANLNLPFHIATIEGYDPFVVGDYVKMMSVAETGQVVLPKRTSGIQLPKNGEKTMDLLNNFGVRYFVQPTIHGAQPWELQLWRYPGQFEKIYGDESYEVYENLFAKEPTEPFDWMKKNQERFFQIGITISTLTIACIGAVIAKNNRLRSKMT